MEQVFVNKVAESGIITLDLEVYLPHQPIVVFDLKGFLFMELIIKEKDFRQALQEWDWTQYQDAIVTVTCSTDAIIPVWAYMLVTTYLQPVASIVYFGTKDETTRRIISDNIAAVDAGSFIDQRVVVKGCGDKDLGPFAYLEATKLLRPVAKSIMYGEPCSTVPIYKRKAAPKTNPAS